MKKVWELPLGTAMPGVGSSAGPPFGSPPRLRSGLRQNRAGFLEKREKGRTPSYFVSMFKDNPRYTSRLKWPTCRERGTRVHGADNNCCLRREHMVRFMVAVHRHFRFSSVRTPETDLLRRMASRTTILQTSLLVCLFGTVSAQIDPAAGILPFSTQAIGGVDLATSNINLTFPV